MGSQSECMRPINGHEFCLNVQLIGGMNLDQTKNLVSTYNRDILF